MSEGDSSGQGLVDTTTAFGRFNLALTKGPIGRFYECEQRNSSVFQELRAGVICFLTCCYIIPVNSGILTDTGGSCDPAVECDPATFAEAGADCRFFDAGYAACQADFRKNLLASTCIAAMLGCMMMSFVARMPLCVAPAMGVNAYFTYNVVGYLATKRVSYQDGLAATFIEGWLFLFLAVTGIRGRLVELIPKNIMFATAAGIGCFLAFLGLEQDEGIGMITFDSATLVTLGGCPPQHRWYMYTIYDVDFTFDKICEGGPDNWTGPVNWMSAKSPNYGCDGGQMKSADTWLGISGGVIMVVLMMKDVKMAILTGILWTTFISWIPKSSATYFGDQSEKPGASDRYTYFLKGAALPYVTRTGGKLNFKGLSKGDTWVALVSFLYLDFMDATSTMYTMARLVGEAVPGFVNERGQWPRQLQTMCVDGASIVAGSLLGCSPLTVFAESAVGIRAGGRTGLTSLTVGCGFGISMFLAPIFASIPGYATGPALILVGSLMMENARYIEWHNVRVAAPAFLTILLMPLTYSIAYGVIIGLAFNIFLWVADAVWESFAVLLGVYKGEKTLRHVWLDTMSQFYVAAGMEEVLVRELPGYVATRIIEEPAMGKTVDA